MRWPGINARKHTIRLLAVVLMGSALFAQTQQPDDSERSPRTVLISIPDRQLAVLEDGEVLATFPVAVGAAVSPSPTGDFEIVTRLDHPTYYHKGSVIPPGKDSPIGTRWVGISLKGFGIHGTNAPRSIGHAQSHGCIRLRNRDMERLFPLLHVGDVVRIRGERDDETARTFGGEDDTATVAAVSAEAGSVGGGQ
jgi:lipoprotein-anchoring transpeptidase ErfK/SrfK